MLEPLALALHPLIPVRTPREGYSNVHYGYYLRVIDGPALNKDDPLLAAFAASVEAVEGTHPNSEPLQADSFDPGRPVRLVPEGVDDDGDEVVGVWDRDEIRRAGRLSWGAAVRVAAGLEHGLELEAFVLAEIRQRSDGRRSGVWVFVHSPALVAVDLASRPALQRPQAPARPRLVLIVDDAVGLRWWDPSGAAGPIDLDAVPVSATVADELRELATAFTNAPDEGDDPDFFDDMEDHWHRHVLDQRTRSVWDRVRRELGRRYAIGLMLRGMTAPAWSPEEFDEDDDDDIPF